MNFLLFHSQFYLWVDQSTDLSDDNEIMNGQRFEI